MLSLDPLLWLTTVIRKMCKIMNIYIHKNKHQLLFNIIIFFLQYFLSFGIWTNWNITNKQLHNSRTLCSWHRTHSKWCPLPSAPNPFVQKPEFHNKSFRQDIDVCCVESSCDVTISRTRTCGGCPPACQENLVSLLLAHPPNRTFNVKSSCRCNL